MGCDEGGEGSVGCKGGVACGAERGAPDGGGLMAFIYPL